jgi:hypothetical protein
MLHRTELAVGRHTSPEDARDKAPALSAAKRAKVLEPVFNLLARPLDVPMAANPL